MFERRHAEPARDPSRRVARRRTRGPRDPLAALRSTAGNRAFAARVLARQVALAPSGDRLQKAGRFDFEADLLKSIPVKSGEHRAHVIPYDEIVASVMDPVNEALKTGNVQFLNALYNLILVIFPGGTGGDVGQMHAGSAKLADLKGVAIKYHGLAAAAYGELLTEVPKVIAKTAPAAVLVAPANKLIGALNNSPANLRRGAGDTNSSIQQGLDFVPAAQTIDTLPAGTAIVNHASMDEDNYTTHQLVNPRTVIRILAAHEQMFWGLLTTTFSKRAMVHAYSSSSKLQSSSHAGMKSATMTNATPTHIAIQVPGTTHYFLFDLN